MISGSAMAVVNTELAWCLKCRSHELRTAKNITRFTVSKA